KVVDRVVSKLRIETRVGDHPAGWQQDRVAIRRGLRDHGRGDIASPGRNILHNELLPPDLAQLLGDEAPDQVAWPTCRGWDDHANRPRWIRLRPSKAGGRRANCGGSNELKKVSARQFHRAPQERVAVKAPNCGTSRRRLQRKDANLVAFDFG